MYRASNAPRVYSYLRFSNPEQSKGDSKRRQTEAAERFAKRKGLTLDASLRMNDEGLSGFHGANRKKGALGRFLDCVEQGQVPSDSVLVVEDLDRLSREDFMNAFETINRLIRGGVSIHTISPEATYDRNSINGGLVWQLVGQMTRAHEESKRKSQLVSAARDNARKMAREEHRVLTRQVPYWLRVEDDKFIAIREAMDAIHMLFDLKLQGVGSHRMETVMNQQAPWTPIKRIKGGKTAPGNGWRASYIKKILTNRAVIGEYQPFKSIGGRNGKRVPTGEPIPDYFPCVVEPNVFHAVQKLLEANRGKGGRNGKATNLFRHLVKCAYCGGPMRYECKGKPPRGARYLVCDNAKRGLLCELHRVRYDECESTILENCHKLDPQQVLPQADAQAKRCKSLRLRVGGMEKELADVELRLTNFTNRVGLASSDEIAKRVYAQMAELEERKTKLKADLGRTSQELHEAESTAQSVSKWKAGFDELRAKLEADDPALRTRLQVHLRELIDKIEVFARGHRKDYDTEAAHRAIVELRRTLKLPYNQLIRTPEAREACDGDDLIEKLLDNLTDGAGRVCQTDTSQNSGAYGSTQPAKKFLDYVDNRRKSKDGRFLRVHFKTGTIIDLVPQGSIASGSTLDRKADRLNQWRRASPTLAQLWRDFEAEQSTR